ncbi:lipoprotein [Nocardia sp. NPDC050697]
MNRRPVLAALAIAALSGCANEPAAHHRARKDPPSP